MTRCSTCTALTACQYTFGDYYSAKSGGGIGCSVPLTAEHAKRVEAEIEKARHTDMGASPMSSHSPFTPPPKQSGILSISTAAQRLARLTA